MPKRTHPTIELPSAAEMLELVGPLSGWAHQCHAASIAFVKKGIVPPGSRVARGTAMGVGGQHSWVVVSTDGQLADCYADDALIVDPTLWSYRSDVEGIWVGRADASPYEHTPFGKGPHIMSMGRPPYPIEEPIPLDPEAYAKLSHEAKHWVDRMFGPLDRRGWIDLASHTTVTGWPAAEIIAAMDDTRELTSLVPVDRLGMLTDRNPGKLYLAEGE